MSVRHREHREQNHFPDAAKMVDGELAGPRLLGRAPVEKQLAWLKEELAKWQEKLAGMEVDALAQLALREKDSCEPQVKARLSFIRQIRQELSWLLGANRPWMKRPNGEVRDPAK